jgi:hypothetical protein
MTDSTTNSAIDNMIGALSSAGADLSSPVKQGHAGVIYNSETDTFEQMTAAPPTNGLTAQPLPDDGRDLLAARDAIVANADALQARLDSGTYDPVTGQKAYNITGREREVLELQLSQAKVSGSYDIDRLNLILAQRNQQTGQLATAEGQSELEQAAARMAFIDGAPAGQRQAFAREYDRLMLEQRTRAVTTAVAAARRR